MHHPHSILMLNFTILIFFRSYNLPYTLFTFHNDAKFYKLDIVKSYNCPYRIVYTHHPHSIMMLNFINQIFIDLTIDHKGHTIHNDAKFYKSDLFRPYNWPLRILYTHDPHSIMMPNFTN